MDKEVRVESSHIAQQRWLARLVGEACPPFLELAFAPGLLEQVVGITRDAALAIAAGWIEHRFIICSMSN
jgi:hypothetical protein